MKSKGDDKFLRMSYTMPKEMVEAVKEASARRKRLGLEGDTCSSLVRVAISRFLHDWEVYKTKRGEEHAPPVD